MAPDPSAPPLVNSAPVMSLKGHLCERPEYGCGSEHRLILMVITTMSVNRGWFCL